MQKNNNNNDYVNINPDNNNGNDSNNEILFWKVIHNKYIFNKIINYIEICEWNKQDSIKQNECTKKFKFITSLEWMVVNKQYSLIKCKLEAGETIEINKKSLQLLLSVYGSSLSLVNNEIPPLQQAPFQLQLQLQLFELLLKYKFNQITTKFELYKEIIISQNVNAFNSLNNNIHNYKFQTNHLEYIVLNSNTKFLDYIINNIVNNNNNYNSLITDQFKNNSIINAFNNENNRDEMLEYILNNNQLYNIPITTTTTTTTKKIKKKKLKLSTSSNNYTVNKLESHYILYIKCDKLKKRLLNLNYFKEINKRLIGSEFKNKSKFEIKLIINNLKQILKNHYTSGSGNGMNEEDYGFTIIKHSYISFETRQLLDMDITFNYLLKYDLPIVGMNLNIVYFYALHKISLVSLKFVYESRLKEGGYKSDNTYGNDIDPLTFKLNFNRPIQEIVDFLKIYTSQQFKFYQNPAFDKCMVDYILSSNSRDNYEQLVNSISQTQKLSCFPQTWNSSISILKNGKREIKFIGKETIDWFISGRVFGNFNEITGQFKFNEKYLGKGSINGIKKSLKFDDITVFEYAFEKLVVPLFQSIQNTNENKISEMKSSLLKIVFRKAIVYCDLNLLFEIEKQFKILNSNFNSQNQLTKNGGVNNKRFRKLIHFDNNCSTNSIILLFNHFYLNGYKLIGDEIFQCLVHMLILKLNGNKSSSFVPLMKRNIDTTNFKGKVNYHCSINGEIEEVEQEYSGGYHKEILLPNVLIDFSVFQQSSIELFEKYICCISPIAILLFYKNNFNPMKSNSKLFNQVWSNHTMNLLDESNRYNDYYTQIIKGEHYNLSYYTHQSLYHISIFGSNNKSLFYDTSNESIDEIIELIEIILNQFKIENVSYGNNNSNDDDDVISYFNLVENVINLLYKRILRSKFATIEKVKYIRMVLTNDTNLPFQFQHSTFHSFYYILLKSPKLLMFIMKLQSLTKVNYKNYNGYLTNQMGLSTLSNYDGQSTSIELLDFVGLIDINYYTFEYLHGDDTFSIKNGNSFYNILSSLINQLVHSNANKYQNLIDNRTTTTTTTTTII